MNLHKKMIYKRKLVKQTGLFIKRFDRVVSKIKGWFQLLNDMLRWFQLLNDLFYVQT